MFPLITRYVSVPVEMVSSKFLIRERCVARGNTLFGTDFIHWEISKFSTLSNFSATKFNMSSEIAGRAEGKTFIILTVWGSLGNCRAPKERNGVFRRQISIKLGLDPGRALEYLKMILNGFRRLEGMYKKFQLTLSGLFPVLLCSYNICNDPDCSVLASGVLL